MFKRSKSLATLCLILCLECCQGSDTRIRNYYSTNKLHTKSTTLSVATPTTSTTSESTISHATTNIETTGIFQQVDRNGYAIYSTEYPMHNEQGEIPNSTEKTQIFLEIAETKNNSQIFNRNFTVDSVINILAQEMNSGHETIGPNTTESLATITLMPKMGKESVIDVNGKLLSDILHIKQFGTTGSHISLENFPLNISKDSFPYDTSNFFNENVTVTHNTPIDSLEFGMKSNSDKKSYNKTNNKPGLLETLYKEKENDKRERHLLTSSKKKYKNIKRNLHKLFNNIMRNKQRKYQTLSEALKRLSVITDLYNPGTQKSFNSNPYLYNWKTMRPLKMLTSHKTRLTRSEEVLLKLLINEFKQYLIGNDIPLETTTESALQTTKSLMKNYKLKTNQKYQKQNMINLMSSKSNTENPKQILEKEMCETIGICDNDIVQKNVNEKEVIDTIRRLMLHTVDYLKKINNHVSTKNQSRLVNISEKLKKIIDDDLGVNYKPPKHINFMKKNVMSKSIKKNNKASSKNKKTAPKSSQKKFIPPKEMERKNTKDDNLLNDTSNTFVQNTTLLTEPKIGIMTATKSIARNESIEDVTVKDEVSFKNETDGTDLFKYQVSYPVITINQTENSSDTLHFIQCNNNLPTYQEFETQVNYINNTHGYQKISLILNYLANLTTRYNKDMVNSIYIHNLEKKFLFNRFYIKGLELIKNNINISMENLSELPTMLQGLEILENNLNIKADKRENETSSICYYFTNFTNHDRKIMDKETTVTKMDIVNYIIKNKLIQLARNMCRKETDTSFKDTVFKEARRAKRFATDSLEDGMI